jgi:hypothetical protein
MKKVNTTIFVGVQSVTKLQYFIAEIALVMSMSHHQSRVWIDYVGDLIMWLI